MTHTYKITGMTCSGCQAKVESVLKSVDGVEQVSIDLAKGEGDIRMSRHIPVREFQQALAPYSKYAIAEAEHAHEVETVAQEEDRTWFETYKPILLLFAFITGASLLIEYTHGNFDVMRWMSHFMAGFFLSFCFFKLLDLSAFTDSYSTYDIIAMRWRSWGYVYATIELLLGIAFLVRFEPLVTNAVTFIVMSVSIVGVIKSVMNKRKIKCACLGAVFNLPMSTVTIIEDAIMIAMSGAMILMLI